MAEYTWRPMTAADSRALAQLEKICQGIDGRYAIPLAADYGIALSNALDSQGALVDDLLVAAGWLTEQPNGLWLRSFVHPEHRGRGLRKQLLRRAIDLATQSGRSLYLHTEASTPEAESLYRHYGFTRIFAEEIMRRNLRTPLQSLPVSAGYNLRPWSEQTAPGFFEVYADAFSDRPGYPAPVMSDWIDEMSEGSRFRPDLSLLATVDGENVGYILCDLDTYLTPREERIAWISQIGVRHSWRGKNIAPALMTRVMETLKRERLDSVLLHVNVNNPSAIRVYLKLGFEIVGRRARYAAQVEQE